MHVISRESLQRSVFYLWDQGERVGGRTQVNKLDGKLVSEGADQL